MKRVLCCLASAFVLLVPSAAYSHETRPGYLELREVSAGRYEVLWKQPAVGDLVLQLNPIFPDTCTVTRAYRQLLPGAMSTRMSLSCPGGLAGSTIRIAGLEDTITSVLVRVYHLDGTEETHLVHPTAPFVTIRGAAGWTERARSYLQMGVEHIILGMDHLLFVLGLLLIIKDRWVLIKTVSAFTVAHSIALAVATLGYANVPGPPLNAAIALSILFLGPEIVRSWRRTDQPHDPATVGGCFCLRVAARLWIRKWSDGHRLAARRSPLCTAAVQHGRGNRSAWLSLFDAAAGTFVPATGNSLADLGGPCSGLSGRFAWRFLDDRAHGHTSWVEPMKVRYSLLLWLVYSLVLTLVCPTSALAHPQGGETAGLLSGLRHPVSGLDHILAMVAVGLWGDQLGQPAVWLLPVTFPMVMAFGGMLGLMGFILPGIEIGIAVSAIILGVMVGWEARPPLWVAAVIVGFFAIFHGNAHGHELPPGADALLYSVGFVVATGCLHALGIALGLIRRWPAGKGTVRASGVAVALAGGYFLWQALS